VFVVDPDRRPSELSKPVAVIPGQVDIVHHLGRVEPVGFLTKGRDGLDEPRCLRLDRVVEELFPSRGRQPMSGIEPTVARGSRCLAVGSSSVL
jgi:hypothetical protein